ncbi:MAG TPA: tetratricopeptide repeat protein [Kofleriaceae bacterium]|nr:tetratricopeptide repeat protein [Kofleriaceae bacterium]
MRLTWWVIGVVALGCGSKHEEHAAATPPGGSAAGSAIAPAGSGSATATLKAPTAQQRADYKLHMNAGWAAQKQSKWPDAVAAFEAALVAVPFDQRAETELGMSAMQAGDLPKAKRADELAVAQAVDHVVEAMARFNFGALLEKTKDAAGALKQYRASLALRPNKTVQAAADRLAQTNTVASAFCAAGQVVCDCVIADAFPNIDADSKPSCTETKSPVPGWHVYHVEQLGSYDYLLDDKHQLVSVIGSNDERGYHIESSHLEKAEIKTIGEHRVLWLQTHDRESEQVASPENDRGPDDVFSEHIENTTSVTICVIGDTTTCPLTVPIDHEVTNDTIDDQVLAALGSAGKITPKAPPVVTKARVTIADDGTATVAVTAGKPDDELQALVGAHKLW